jgi:beta-phosphoglucomutase-like phosphatase (HAD superfamily)
MPKAAIFDVDGTLLVSVDLHALAWHEAMVRLGQDVSFEQARSQIGKGATSSFRYSYRRTNSATTVRRLIPVGVLLCSA